jgi:hypothetical protein
MNLSILPFTIPDLQATLQSRQIAIYNLKTGKPFYKDEPLENLRLTLAEKLRTELQATNYFSSVKLLSNRDTAKTDLIIAGAFVTIYQMSGKIQLIAYPVSRLAITGKLIIRDSSQTAMEFTCQGYAEAGWINRPKKQMRKNIANIAKDMRKLLTKD